MSTLNFASALAANLRDEMTSRRDGARPSNAATAAASSIPSHAGGEPEPQHRQTGAARRDNGRAANGQPGNFSSPQRETSSRQRVRSA